MSTERSSFQLEKLMRFVWTSFDKNCFFTIEVMIYIYVCDSILFRGQQRVPKHPFRG